MKEPNEPLRLGGVSVAMKRIAADGQRARALGSTGTRRWGTVAARWLVVVAAIAAAASCISDDTGITDAVLVQNKTAVTLHFTLVLPDGQPFALSDKVLPGQTYALLSGSQLSPGARMMVDRCTAGDLIAYDPSGQEVARHPPGLCARTKDVWTIGPTASPRPSG